MGNIKYTHHARQSMGNRAVRDEDIEYVLEHGSAMPQRSGRTVYFCGKKCERSSARNLAVVEGEDGVVITAIRTTSLKKFRENAEMGRTLHV